MIANVYYTEKHNKNGIAIYTDDGVYDLFYADGIGGTPNALKSMYRLKAEGYELNLCGFVK